MSDQVKLAREWAERIMSAPGMCPAPMRAAAEFILANTRPQTMADVKWSHEEHSLRGATDSYGDATFVMLDMQRPDEESELELFVWDGTDVTRDRPDYYTPNGKRYEIREITETEHPATLATLEDYRDAPVGTIVADDWDCPHTKIDDGRWSFRDKDHVPLDTMAVTESRVLRWGWGE